jgi:uncharacterized protein YjiS (DUF1127 family)
MTTILAQIRDAARKRALYNATVAELSTLPVELAIEDLGIWPGDARRIARRAVYGS